MSLQNRVDPWGAINRSHAGGTLMSNRGGALHNEQREILCPFKNRRWITCLLAFKGRKRSVMSPRRYTELFFLDEAVALAAGHRPCVECRRERLHAFKDSWMRREEVDLSVPLRAAPVRLATDVPTFMKKSSTPSGPAPSGETNSLRYHENETGVIAPARAVR
jgi:hypothetical protein